MDAIYEEKIARGEYPFQSHLQQKAKPGIIAKAHLHDYIEILYCQAGEQELYLGGKPYAFSPGDLAIINSREVHHILTRTGAARYVVVKFQPELLYSPFQSIGESRYLRPFTMQESAHQRVFAARELAGTGIPLLIEDIHREYSGRRYGFELAVRANICKLFLWILRRWSDEGVDLGIGQEMDDQAMRKLEAAFDYVDSHYSEEITVEQMARCCGMSYSYFSRLFKRVMRRNFSQYVSFVRINEAEKLLTGTDMNITEIALEVGFSSSAYFIRQFRYYKNMSPKRYRKYLREWSDMKV